MSIAPQPFQRPARAAPPRAAPASAAGFTYIGLLIAIVLLGVALSAVGTVWRTTAQREREQELLFIGRAYQTAITDYYEAGRQLPQSLDDLVEDKRWPKARHFLRRLYADPMTGQVDWVLIRNDSSGITGVASSSTAEPIKKGGFRTDEESFADAQSYEEWKFIFTPRMGHWKSNVTPVPVN
jgi:type II secretory pathway pseudopilin PulG